MQHTYFNRTPKIAAPALNSLSPELTSEDETLLVWGDSLLVLNLGLDILDGVRGLHLQGDGLPSQRLDEDLHPTAETEDQVKGTLLLDIVVREGSPILELFP